MENLTYYEILKVPENATIREIRQSYRQRCKEYHPDIKGNNPIFHEMMCKVNEAYEVLSEIETRIAYDRLLSMQRTSETKEDKTPKTGAEVYTPDSYKAASYDNDYYTSDNQRETYSSYYAKENDFDYDEYVEFINWIEDYIVSYEKSFVKRYNDDINYRTNANLNLFMRVKNKIEEIAILTREKMNNLFKRKTRHN